MKQQPLNCRHGKCLRKPPRPRRRRQTQRLERKRSQTGLLSRRGKKRAARWENKFLRKRRPAAAFRAGAERKAEGKAAGLIRARAVWADVGERLAHLISDMFQRKIRRGGGGRTNKTQQKQKVAIWNTRTAAHVLGIPDQLEASEKVATDFLFCCCYFCLSKSWSGFHPERETLTGAGVLQASGGVRTARQQDKPSKGSLLKQTSSTTHIPWIKSPERKWSAALWRLLDQTSCLSGEFSRKINRANNNNFAF